MSHILLDNKRFICGFNLFKHNTYLVWWLLFLRQIEFELS